MPGKYSHSVVLADYSSRGVISLPPEQHVKYAESTPQPYRSPVSQARILSTGSIEASRKESSLIKDDASRSEVPRIPPKVNATSKPTTANVSIRSDESRIEPSRHQRYYKHVTHSSPAVNAVSQPDAPSAYEQQQHRFSAIQIDRSLVNDILSLGPQRSSRYNNPDQERRPNRPTVGHSPSNTNLPREAPSPTEQHKSPLLDVRKDNSSKTAAVVSARVPAPTPRKIPVTHISQKTTIPVPDSARVKMKATSTGKRSNEGHLSPEIQKSPMTPTAEKDRAIHEQRQRREVQSTVAAKKLMNVERSISNHSKNSRNTQIWDPAPNLLEEPNFDGFSDDDGKPKSYFEVPKRSGVEHSRESSMNSAFMIQQPEAREGAKNRNQQSQSTRTASSQAASVKTADRNTPSRTTPSSTIDSSYGQLSASSVSSVSIPNSQPQTKTSRKIETRENIVREQPIVPGFRLLEIREDNGFSPSIFEDREVEDAMHKVDSIDFGSSIGQISSGKDVSHDTDSASELSAAMPPPISRFKDDEDEFNANMAKLFGEGGDYAINQKGSHTIGRTTAKKKGFFSKFRPRSQSQNQAQAR